MLHTLSVIASLPLIALYIVVSFWIVRAILKAICAFFKAIVGE